MNDAAPTPAFPNYAGFWRRFNAYGIDATIVVLIAWLIDYFLFGKAFAQTTDDLGQLAIALQNGQIDPALMDKVKAGLLSSMFGGSLIGPNEYVTIAVSAFYNIFFVTGNWQATPGKHWLHLKVLMANGRPLTLQQSALRHALSGLSMLPLGLGCLTICFTREKLAPHDMILGTRVIHERRRREW